MPTTSRSASANSSARERPRIVRPTCQSPVCSSLTGTAYACERQESHACNSRGDREPTQRPDRGQERWQERRHLAGGRDPERRPKPQVAPEHAPEERADRDDPPRDEAVRREGATQEPVGGGRLE